MKTKTEELRKLVEELSARPLVTEGPRRRRLPKATSRFIRKEIESCRDDGQPVRHCVTLAYWRARKQGLL
jgi:hypothetical protein